MSTKSKTALSKVNEAAEEHLSVAKFLLEHADLLASLDFDTMSDKLGTRYGATPYVSFWTDCDRVTMQVSGPDALDTMRTLRKAIGGKWEKSGSRYDFTITRKWQNILIEIMGDRSAVCQKVVVGTHEVTHPAIEAQPERTETVEDVEWVCGNLLDNGQDED